MYTLKQVHTEPDAMNTPKAIEARHQCAIEIKAHQDTGAFITYFDETNFNLFLHRNHGQAPRGSCTQLVLLPKSNNCQVQMGVNAQLGVVLAHTNEGTVTKKITAAFLIELYQTALNSQVYQQQYSGKSIVIVYDNAPNHRQSEDLVEQMLMLEGAPEGQFLVLQRLPTYLPQLKPIEGCFSVLKSHLKQKLRNL